MLKDQPKRYTYGQCYGWRGPGQCADGKQQTQEKNDSGERVQEGYPSPRGVYRKVFKMQWVSKSYPPSLTCEKGYAYP